MRIIHVFIVVLVVVVVVIEFVADIVIFVDNIVVAASGHGFLFSSTSFLGWREHVKKKKKGKERNLIFPSSLFRS